MIGLWLAWASPTTLAVDESAQLGDSCHIAGFDPEAERLPPAFRGVRNRFEQYPTLPTTLDYDLYRGIQDCDLALDAAVLTGGTVRTRRNHTHSVLCFRDQLLAPVLEGEAEDWTTLSALLAHFDGFQTADRRWFMRPRGGFESFLMVWSMGGGSWSEVNEELFVANVLTDMLHVEGMAAVSIARLYECHRAHGDLESVDFHEDLEQLEHAWARRVYVLTTSLHGRAGALLREERPEVVPVLEGLLAEATTSLGYHMPVPPRVAEAMTVTRSPDAPGPWVVGAP